MGVGGDGGGGLCAAGVVAGAVGMERVTIEDPLRKSWPVFAVLGVWVMHQAVSIVPMPAVGWRSLSTGVGADLVADGGPGDQARSMTISIEPHASRGVAGEDARLHRDLLSYFSRW